MTVELYSCSSFHFKRNLKLEKRSVQIFINKNYNSTEEHKIKMKWKWENICFWTRYQAGSVQGSEGPFKEITERIRANESPLGLARTEPSAPIGLKDRKEEAIIGRQIEKQARVVQWGLRDVAISKWWPEGEERRGEITRAHSCLASWHLASVFHHLYTFEMDLTIGCSSQRSVSRAYNMIERRKIGSWEANGDCNAQMIN